jgi:hypothetical protein
MKITSVLSILLVFFIAGCATQGKIAEDGHTELVSDVLARSGRQERIAEAQSAALRGDDLFRSGWD